MKTFAILTAALALTMTFFSATTKAASYGPAPYKFFCIEQNLTATLPVFAEGTYNYDGQLTDVSLGEVEGMNTPNSKKINVTVFANAKPSRLASDIDSSPEWIKTVPFALGNTENLENIILHVQPETLRSTEWAGQKMRMNALFQGLKISPRTLLCQ